MSLQGGDMFDAIVTADKYRYTERTASHVMLQLLNAVDYLHSIRIAHRNIRLENILVSLLQLSSSAWMNEWNCLFTVRWKTRASFVYRTKNMR